MRQRGPDQQRRLIPDGRPGPREDLDALAGGCSALGHPLRLRLLYAIRGRGDSSPVELAGLIAPDTRPVTAVAYHVRRLFGAGLIELVKTRPVRGALEHHYRITGRGRAWLAALDSLDRPG